jgi:hypothetical protein
MLLAYLFNLFIFCWIIAEDAAQVARQFLLRAVMRCLCPFLHRVPPPPFLGMSLMSIWHIDHLMFCLCKSDFFSHWNCLQSGHGKLARQMTLLMAFSDYLGNVVKVIIYLS